MDRSRVIIPAAVLPAVVAACLLAGAVRASAPASILILTDRTDALYKCGEPATFFVTLIADTGMLCEGEVSVKLSLDGGRVIEEKTVGLGRSPAAVKATLYEPGFLLCTVTYDDHRKNVVEHSSVGFEPESIKPTAVLPDDFYDFWREGRTRLDSIPLDLRLTAMPAYNTYTHENFEFSFANINGSRCYGFLSVPVNRKPPFPAYVTVDGAGYGPVAPLGAVWATEGALGMVVSVHDYDCGLPGHELRQRFNDLTREKPYGCRGAPDRETYYFRRAILGIDRAVNYLASREDFDGEHLVFAGASQGGAMALILAGLNPQVTAVAATIPAMCEHSAALADRQAGWPRLLQGAPDEGRQEYLEMGYYYDVVNFARTIKCPVIIIAGLKDRTCPPSGIVAVYNVIDAPKHLFTDPHAGHQSRFASFDKFRENWIGGQLGLREVVPPTRAALAAPAAAE